MKKNTKLYGSGSLSKVIFGYRGKSGFPYNYSLPQNFIGVENGDGNEIHNLVFVGQGTGISIVGSNDIVSNGAMVVLWNSKNVSIHDVQFLKHEGLSILVTQGSANFQIYDNFGWMCNFELVHIRGGAHDGLVFGNEIRNAGDDAISVVWYQNDLLQPNFIEIFENNLFDCDGGINVSHARDIIIRNNFVSNSKLAGIKVSYWDRGNIFDKTSPSFVPSDPSERISIYYNQIVNCGSGRNEPEDWDASSLNSIFLYGIRDSDVYSNHIWRDIPVNPINTNLQKVAIRLMDFNNVKVRNNPIDCNGLIDIGIALFNWITPTPVNNKNVHSFYKLEISGNWITRPAATGFSLNPPSGNFLQNVSILNNGIIDCQGAVAGWMNNHVNSTLTNNVVNNGKPIIY